MRGRAHGTEGDLASTGPPGPTGTPAQRPARGGLRRADAEPRRPSSLIPLSVASQTLPARSLQQGCGALGLAPGAGPLGRRERACQPRAGGVPPGHRARGPPGRPSALGRAPLGAPRLTRRLPPASLARARSRSPRRPNPPGLTALVRGPPYRSRRCLGHGPALPGPARPESPPPPRGPTQAGPRPLRRRARPALARPWARCSGAGARQGRGAAGRRSSGAGRLSRARPQRPLSWRFVGTERSRNGSGLDAPQAAAARPLPAPAATSAPRLGRLGPGGGLGSTGTCLLARPENAPQMGAQGPKPGLVCAVVLPGGPVRRDRLMGGARAGGQPVLERWKRRREIRVAGRTQGSCGLE